MFGVAIGVALLALVAPPSASAAQPPKEAQTAAQRKIDSRLLRAIERARRGRRQPPDALLQIDAKGRALVELRADVTPALAARLRALRATTVSVLPDYRSVLAWVPLTALESLAADDNVYGIQPAPQGTTNKRPKGSR